MKMTEKINKKNALRWMVTALVVAYIGASVILFSGTARTRICTTCHITIADSTTLRFVTPRDVAAMLEKDNLSPLGIRAEFIDIAKIEKSLGEKSRIKRAECYFSPSGATKVIVYQREPIIRIMTAHRNYYVDREGKVMGVADNFAAYVPIATGHITEKFAQESLFQFALFLHEDKFWNALIEQIDVDAKQEITLVPRVGGQLIRLGTIDGYQKKLKKLMVLYKNGFNKIGWNNYKEINLKYEGQIVCTKK